MDVLYYIGSGSHHHNDELRYSLRSLEKYCKDVERVFVVGNKPAFLKNVEYIWIEDQFERWKNAFKKTKAAIKAGISNEFLLMNDDFFMLSDFEAANYPFYHKGDMPLVAKNKYQEVIVNTRLILQKQKKPFKHYGVHCPIRINAEKYLSLETYFNEAVSARCLYGNLFCKGIKTTDNKGLKIKRSRQKCFSSIEWVEEDVFENLKKCFLNHQNGRMKMFEEVLLPNGCLACSSADVDRYLKESGLSLAGDYSTAYLKNIRRKNQELQRKEAFDDFINEYKKRIWNE